MGADGRTGLAGHRVSAGEADKMQTDTITKGSVATITNTTRLTNMLLDNVYSILFVFL